MAAFQSGALELESDTQEYDFGGINNLYKGKINALRSWGEGLHSEFLSNPYMV